MTEHKSETERSRLIRELAAELRGDAEEEEEEEDQQ